MPRMRSIKPEFFTDAELCDLPPLHRILFAGLWCHEDRNGCVEDKPKELKVKILPYDACNVDSMLQDLADAGFIIRYEVNGERFICTPAFKEHQRPHPQEKDSGIPQPPPQSGNLTAKHDASPMSVAPKQESHRVQELLKTPGAGAGALAGAGSWSLPPEHADEKTAAVVGEEATEFSFTPTGFWKWSQSERRQRGLDVERVKPAKYDGWYTAAAARAGPEALGRAYLRFLADEHFRERGWPIAVFIAEAVWSSRTAEPKPQQRRRM